jgi:arylamine N-acetyltransferase
VAGARRVNLFNVDLSLREADGRGEHRILANARELAELLEDTMGIALPAPAEMIWKKAVNSYKSTDVQS